MKSVDQRLFDALYKLSTSLGYDTHDVLPMNEVPYPFVVIGEVQFLPKATTTAVIGKMVITVDVWGNQEQRRKIAEISEKIMLSSNFIVLDDRKASLNLNASNKRVLRDISTGSTLWHGVLELEFLII